MHVRKTTALLLVALVFSCGEAQQTSESKLRVFAAASLANVLPEIAEAFTAETQVAVEFNFAGSSLLARQIEAGAAADIFFSANTDWIDRLQQEGLLDSVNTGTPIGNSLVVITPAALPKTKIRSLSALTAEDIRRIAVGDWTHVPAGIYAKLALQRAGLWEQLEQRLVPALDVRSALAFVERGNVDCGLVYRTDATISQRVTVALVLPDSLQPDIQYGVAKLQKSRHPASDLFLQFLAGPQAMQRFRAHGFQIIESHGDGPPS